MRQLSFWINHPGIFLAPDFILCEIINVLTDQKDFFLVTWDKKHPDGYIRYPIVPCFLPSTFLSEARELFILLILTYIAPGIVPWHSRYSVNIFELKKKGKTKSMFSGDYIKRNLKKFHTHSIWYMQNPLKYVTVLFSFTFPSSVISSSAIFVCVGWGREGRGGEELGLLRKEKDILLSF